MRHFTFNHIDKVSDTSHEHCTLRFANGTIWILTRESSRSVAAQWDEIGTYSERFNCVRFTEDSMATLLAATQMYRKGYKVVGFNRKRLTESFGEIETLNSDGIVTNPESIKGRIRDRSLNRPNSVAKGERGASRFRANGRQGATDLVNMRRAVIEAQLNRK